MKTNTLAALAIVTLAAAGPIGAVYAQQATTPSANAEQQAMAAVKVTATEAVAAAEKMGTGNVTELSLDLGGTMPGYRVTVAAADGTETNYLVDANTGTAVLFMEANSNDGGQDGEQNDGGPENGNEAGAENGESGESNGQ